MLWMLCFNLSIYSINTLIYFIDRHINIYLMFADIIHWTRGVYVFVIEEISSMRGRTSQMFGQVYFHLCFVFVFLYLYSKHFLLVY